MNSDISEKYNYLKHQFALLLQGKDETDLLFPSKYDLALVVAINLEDRMESFQIFICLHTF